MQDKLFRKGLVVGIIVLFIFSAFTKMVFGQTNEDGNIIIVDDEGDGDYTSIKEVVNHANPSDTIEVYSGIANNSFLNYAEGAADWLINEAIVVGDGYKWPDSVGSYYYYTDLYYGSPGIVTLFSKLYETIADEEYFQYAVGGAQWLIERATPEADGFKWPQREGLSLYYTGLYVGTAGTGDAFLNLYETLSDPIYLEYATGAANWLLSVAIFENQDECKWPSSQYTADYCTDIIYGAAGVGLFLLRMYNLTNNPEYLDYARYTGNWLVNQAIPVGSGYKWEVSNNCPYIYTGFSHGAAGIGYFLAELFEHTDESQFLEYAEGAGQWLIDIAIPEAGGCKWWSKEGDTPSYATGWCHGPAGTCLLFMKLYQITSDNIYLTYAEMGGTWLISLATPSGGGYKWPHYQGYPTYDITICHGAAGIGDFFLKMFALTNEGIYYDYAEGAAEWLKSVADTSAGGYRWATFGSYYTGFSTGTSGVGLFFLDLENLPPDPPGAPDGPDEGITDVEYEFSAVTTDPDEDQIYYNFSWGDGTYSGWIGPVPSGTSVEESHAWDEAGDYDVKVKAKDVNDIESDWSEPFEITIFENNPPTPPDIVGPTKGKAGTPYAYKFTSTDPNGDQVSYYIKWDDGSITDWTAFQASGSPGHSESHTWDEQGRYKIEAKAKDIYGIESDWTELEVTMPRNKIATNNLFQTLFKHFLNLFPILKILSHRLGLQ
jgi:hypothetical protein